MPVCSKCGKNRRISSFTKRANGKLYYHCKICQREYTKSHYKANKEYYFAKAKRNDEKYEAPILEFLRQCKNVPCADCGKTYPHYVMEFDHVRGEKLFNLSNFRRYASLEKVKLEVSKCEVVCSNCHQTRTYLRLHPEEIPSGCTEPL